MTQDGGKILSIAQGAMLIGIILHGPGETLVPFRPILVFQKRVGAFQSTDVGQSQLLDQAILRRQETAFHAAFGLRRAPSRALS